MRMFAYQLAVKLGHVNVDRMLSEIDSRQLSEWMAFANLDPFDESRADIRSAIVAQTVAAASGSKRTFRLQDFMIQYGNREHKQQSLADAKMVVKNYMNARNKIKNKK